MAPGVEGAALPGVEGPGVAGADLAPGVAGPGVAGADEAPGVVGACFGMGSLPALNPSRCFQSALYMEFLFFFFSSVSRACNSASVYFTTNAFHSAELVGFGRFCFLR